jgi:subtilase family serine protease
MNVDLCLKYGPNGPAARAAVLTTALLLPGTALASATVPVPADTKSAVQLAHATLVGATASARQIKLSITLPLRDAAGAASLAQHVSTPGDPLYRHYLTPAQYAARFGTSVADYRLVAAWAKSQGLTPGEEFSAHNVLPLTGTVAALKAAFGTQFNDFRDSTGRVFYAATGAVQVPQEIASRISAVIGLSNMNHFQPLAKRLPAGMPLSIGGSGPGGAYSASDLRTIYSVPPQPVGTKAETAAVFEQGGFDPNDISTYELRNKLPATPATFRSVDGYGGAINSPDIEAEAVLDIDMMIGLNPAVGKVLVYEAGATEDFGTALVDSYAAMATDNKAQTISISYGLDEALQNPATLQAENTGLTQLVAQGQGVYVSSGDQGAYGDEGNGLNVSDPGAQPNVVGVGGTTLFTGQKASYRYSTVWNELGTSIGAATGGGVSAVWPIPAYQIGSGQNGVHNMTRNGGSATSRNGPDVAAVADPLTGVAVYSKINGGWLTLGGTSVSAPVVASIMSIGNAISKWWSFGPLGFTNPAIYAMEENMTTQALLQGDFNDTWYGNNGDVADYGIPGFSAGQNYDNTTGWGSPVGDHMLADLALQPAINNTNNPPAAPNGVSDTATSSSIAVKWAKVTGASGYFALAYNTSSRVFNVVESKSSSLTFTGLVSNTVYELEVFSVSNGGTGASAVYFATTAKQ